MLRTIQKFCSGDQIKNNEMGGACGTYGGQETMKHGFGVESPKERKHLQDFAIDVSIILKWILQTLVWRSWTGSI